MAVQLRLQVICLINCAKRDVDHARKIVIGRCQRRVAGLTIPTVHTGIDRHRRTPFRRKPYVFCCESCKSAHRSPGAAPAVLTMTIGDNAGALGRRKRRRTAIAAPGNPKIAPRVCVRRQPGEPRLLQECNGAEGSRCPFSGSASKMGNRRMRPACAGKQHRVQSRGT